MVVIVLLSVLAGIAIPTMVNSISGVRLEAATRNVVSLMDYCYQSSLATGRVHTLTFSPDGRWFNILAEVPEDWMAEGDYDPFNPIMEPIGLPGFYEQRLPEGVEIAEAELYESDLAFIETGELQILFFPDGTTEFLVLTLMNEDGDRRVIDMNGLTGSIAVIDPAAIPGYDDAERPSRVTKRDLDTIGP
jgi:type II secretory pathway pseudopilin PulG